MHEQEMWEEDLKQAIHQITPDAQQKEQMWDRLQHTISENGTQKQTADDHYGSTTVRGSSRCI